jgi:DNA repair exonuclease SbcCD ATPase subunit
LKKELQQQSDEKENVYIKKTSVGGKQKQIKDNETLIADFKAQEYRDLVMNLYKKCVHRDGIPRQMLSNYIIPKINLTLENILSVAPFKVWLDQEDLRPKLAYNNRPMAIIDCISASGKERTFGSVVLKFALNQINVKAKPTIFLLDEVMGKLDLEGSVEEFVEILQMIKQNMKKVLVIEQVHEINPDYLISVQLNEDGISSLVIE